MYQDHPGYWGRLGRGPCLGGTSDYEEGDGHTSEYRADHVTDGGQKNLRGLEEKQSIFLGVGNEKLTSKLEGC